jgi:hypothetical protein
MAILIVTPSCADREERGLALLIENADDLLESLLERGIEEAETDSAQSDVREHGIGQEVVG